MCFLNKGPDGIGIQPLSLSTDDGPDPETLETIKEKTVSLEPSVRKINRIFVLTSFRRSGVFRNTRILCVEHNSTLQPELDTETLRIG